MKKIFLIICLFALVMQAFSNSVLERFEGNYISNIDSRSAAMGGATVSGGKRLFDADINPANLALIDSQYGGSFYFRFLRNEEKRSFPMYNFFDTYVGDATYVANENYFHNMAFGLHGAYHFMNFKLAAGLLYTPHLSFDCDYDEQVRNDEGSDEDNYPPILAKNWIDGEGTLNKLAFILSLQHHERFSWGVSLAKISGEQEYGRGIFWTPAAIELADNPEFLYDIEEHLKRDFDAVQLSLGGNYKATKRLQIGFAYTPSTEFDVEGDWSAKAINSEQDTLFVMSDVIDSVVYSYEGSWELNEDSLQVFVPKNVRYYDDFKSPSRFRIGLSYQPQNIMRTYFNVDLEHVKWSDVNPLFDDEINYYVGVEHQVSNYLPLRLGFRYETNYQINHREMEKDGEFHTVYFGDKISMPTFTAGTGFSFLEHFTVDISGEFSHRTYESLDLFPDSFYAHDGLFETLEPEDRGWENPDTIKENFTFLKFALSYRW